MCFNYQVRICTANVFGMVPIYVGENVSRAFRFDWLIGIYLSEVEYHWPRAWFIQEWFCVNLCYFIYTILIPSDINSRLLWHSCVFKPTYRAQILMITLISSQKSPTPNISAASLHILILLKQKHAYKCKNIAFPYFAHSFS